MLAFTRVRLWARSHIRLLAVAALPLLTVILAACQNGGGGGVPGY